MHTHTYPHIPTHIPTYTHTYIHTPHTYTHTNTYSHPCTNFKSNSSQFHHIRTALFQRRHMFSPAPSERSPAHNARPAQIARRQGRHSLMEVGRRRMQGFHVVPGGDLALEYRHLSVAAVPVLRGEVKGQRRGSTRGGMLTVCY